MQYLTIPVTAFQQNCSIIWCETTLECAFVDPGGDTDKLIAVVKQHGLQPIGVFLTHAHLDHVGGTVALAKHYHMPIIGPHAADKYWLDALPVQAKQFGLPHCDAFVPDTWLQEGDSLTLGQQTLEIIHTPGHTPGHVVLFHREQGIAFVGDVLFNGSIGRSDFPGGNHQQLLQSIKAKLWSLGDDVIVIPGHGPNTTIGHERLHNPFIP
ncbi:MBL fold metallo-hydrolase [Thiothrix subterranea]|uniref:MBL fold metallo-hydrolase n=1 Tax=Thiothrix subterranea TaxID=2735563 RepID=A0AA51MR80_9GAMM|nr:MBL fold metallo-hydrolase [Thiothrix subterranea]MDQ5768294.1 MBL fold metallo-hydrolase [Thiothrix subterranea]WML87821.1 MBL fold metallo-hydrolase [Thiothrix subterranea]